MIAILSYLKTAQNTFQQPQFVLLAELQFCTVFLSYLPRYSSTPSVTSIRFEGSQRDTPPLRSVHAPAARAGPPQAKNLEVLYGSESDFLRFGVPFWTINLITNLVVFHLTESGNLILVPLRIFRDKKQLTCNIRTQSGAELVDQTAC